ncbi:uncharacterized protein LOC122533287 [Frieseomelitta varia]|uniref:uncharacterized protein LOC122533287 n=1 Tax=Frieseomelitta varia TaxID=561572 RepID=UPI001CB6822E|nr:uncharacterized protein LOC122533287 [Frieseomelitta varia]
MNVGVRPWEDPLDSRDASSEYTSEESDGEKQSVSSEDLQSSVATYRRFEGALGCTSQSVSQEIFDDADKTPVNEGHPMLDPSTPKVVMRSKQKNNGPRPWSVSCISQIGNNSGLNQTNDPISSAQFSISETALHQLIATPPTKSVSLDATASRKPFNNSTSTLLEQSMICHDDRVVRNSSLRRKKSRLRKKNLGRKSDSSLEGVNANHSAGSDGSSSNQQRSARKMNGNRSVRTVSRDCHGRLTTLVKSGSFSGCTAHQQLSAERTIVSDPTPPFRLPCCTSVASTSETEGEEQRNCTRGRFAFDDNLFDNVLNNKELCSQQMNADSDIEMNSLGNNSFSEQAWDNYQEKYMSEPYSEAPDIETARRLLEFGDDYRNFLDSQSDCASSMSAMPASSSPLARRRMHEITDTTEDSDSDIEDIRNLVEKSQCQLSLAENLFSRSCNGAEDYTEVQCACSENLRCLHALLESVSNSFRSEKYVKQVRGMLEKWESLTTRVEETQMATALHRELTALRTEFKAAHDRLFSYEIALEQPHILDERINRITAELAALRDRKAAMLALNVQTHRLITDVGNSSSLIFTALKDGVADLYRVWDETFQKGNQQLCALQAVQQFSIRLAELQCALRRDKDTLAVLDVALQAGATSEVASSVRHVARLLSEKQDMNCQGLGWSN